MSSSDQMNTLYPTYHIHVLTFLAVRPLNDIHVFLNWQHLVKKKRRKKDRNYNPNNNVHVYIPKGPQS